MKIALLSRSPRCYSSRRLKEAAEKRGHTIKALDSLKFGLFLEKDEPDLTFRGKTLSDYDAIIPRIGTSITFYGTAVVRQFEQMGVYCLNPSHGISVSRDKLRSLQVLCRHNIGMPATAFAGTREDILPAIERVGGAPVVIKLLEGTQGIGVILAESNKIAEAIIETLQSKQLNVLVQKFVAESKGKDVRALVVGDKVIAAMRRSAVGTEFRSNVHRGGTTQAIELPEDYQAVAVRAAQVLGLRVAGVDMLEGATGPQIMEVNSSPGLEGIEGATGQDIAGEIIKYLEDQVQFQDFDIRQRLTTARGYQVAEFTVQPNSELDGKELRESGMRDKDIVVLSLNRNGQVVANPKSSRTFMAGDRVLCYGTATALKTYLPVLGAEQVKRKRKRKPAAKKTTA